MEKCCKCLKEFKKEELWQIKKDKFTCKKNEKQCNIIFNTCIKEKADKIFLEAACKGIDLYSMEWFNLRHKLHFNTTESFNNLFVNKDSTIAIEYDDNQFPEIYYDTKEFFIDQEKNIVKELNIKKKYKLGYNFDMKKIHDEYNYQYPIEQKEEKKKKKKFYEKFLLLKNKLFKK